MTPIVANTTLHQAYCRVCLVMVIWTSFNCRPVEPANNREGSDAIQSENALYYLDLNQPSLTQAIESKSAGKEEAYKFVEVEVTEVRNQNKHPLTFEVRYQTKDAVKIYLGSFSLYPADNPGKFIVATQGKVKDEGAIILSLVPPDRVDAKDAIRVAVKRIKLLKG